MLIEEIRAQIEARLKELQPAVDEYRSLEPMGQIIDLYEAELDKLRNDLRIERHKLVIARKTRIAPRTSTRERVESYIKGTELGDTFRPKDMQRELDLNTSVAQNWVAKMLEEGRIERFGKGLYRRPLEKTGEARLRVVTK